jgi:hypothetical protein
MNYSIVFPFFLSHIWQRQHICLVVNMLHWTTHWWFPVALSTYEIILNIYYIHFATFFYEYVLNVQCAQNIGKREKKYLVRSVIIYIYHLILLGWLNEGWDARNIHYLGEKEDMHITCLVENLKGRESCGDIAVMRGIY